MNTLFDYLNVAESFVYIAPYYFGVPVFLPASQVAYWRTRGIHPLDQAQTGAVTMRVDRDGALVIEGYVDGSSLRLTR